MTNNYSSCTFRYRAILVDGSKQYFFDMADLRRSIKISDLSKQGYAVTERHSMYYPTAYILFRK